MIKILNFGKFDVEYKLVPINLDGAAFKGVVRIFGADGLVEQTEGVFSWYDFYDPYKFIIVDTEDCFGYYYFVNNDNKMITLFDVIEENT